MIPPDEMAQWQASMNATQHGYQLNQAWRQAQQVKAPEMEPLFLRDGTPYTGGPIPPQRSHAELSAQARRQPRDGQGRFAEIPHGMKPGEVELGRKHAERGLKQAWPHGTGAGASAGGKAVRTTKNGKTVRRARPKTAVQAQTAKQAKRPLLPGLFRRKRKRKPPLHKRGLIGKVRALFSGEYGRWRRREARKNWPVPLEKKPKKRRKQQGQQDKPERPARRIGFTLFGADVTILEW